MWYSENFKLGTYLLTWDTLIVKTRVILLPSKEKKIYLRCKRKHKETNKN